MIFFIKLHTECQHTYEIELRQIDLIHHWKLDIASPFFKPAIQ